MRFDRTKTYINHVTTLRSERATLLTEIDAIASLKRGTRTAEQKTQLALLRSRLKTVERNLDGLHDMSSLTWPELFQLLVEVNECEWTPEQVALLDGDLEAYEGRGERALRHRFSLPLEASQGSCDFPDDGEGKYLGSELRSFRVGKVGKRAYGRLCRAIIRAHVEDAMTPEQWDALSDGEVSAGKVYHDLPEQIRTCLQSCLAPSEVLSCYQTIYLMTDAGFVRVPRKDFSTAFALSAVTQMSPTYRLRRDYVEARVHAVSVAEAG